ncbi:DUF5906 domain-containing protein [Testudinibacter sp. P80/BLE/0925]|uniref:DUF5906 domain-containing protein n=1 Tax=Testudinibacter sp. TW-1 TaxID=3417757 RepID=UPI003D36B288
MPIIYGATAQQWDHFANALNLAADLLPVVSDPNVKISPRSRIKRAGKLPSIVNNNGFIAGLDSWPNRKVEKSSIEAWKKDSRLGICIRLGKSEYCVTTRKVLRQEAENSKKYCVTGQKTTYAVVGTGYCVDEKSADDAVLSDKVRSSYIYALDCDLEDDDSLQMISNSLLQVLGLTPPRRFRSNANKCLYLFAVEGEPMTKRVMRLENDEIIEFLGKGQHFVAVGTHTSGVRYEWENGLPTEIPVVSAEAFENLWAALEMTLPLKNTQASALSKNRDLSHGDRTSVDEVTKYLDQHWTVFGIGNRGERFIKCPFEHEHTSEGNDTSTAYFPADTGGFERGHFKCQHAHCAHRNDGDFLNAIGFRDNDFEDVKENEEIADKVAYFCKRYLYMAENDRVCDLDSTPHSYKFKLSEFKNYTANVTRTVLKGKQQVQEPIHKAWLEHKDRKSAIGSVYLPGQPRLIMDENKNWLHNEFYLPQIDTVETREFLPHFLAHLEYLIPNIKERNHFIQWMASLRKHPERRNKVTNMLVAIAHGTGRGWVVELLQKLLGHWNCKKCKMADLVDGQFNGYLHQSLLCSVEEVKERSERFAISDKVRDTLTENYLEVNIKYGAKRTQPVYTNFFFMTNHTDALVIKQEDRRINVFAGPEQAKDKAYYDRLYRLLDNRQFIAEVYSYLMQIDLSDYQWTHSFDTPARRNMIEFNMNDTERAFTEFMSDPPALAMTMPQVVAYLKGGNDFDSEIDEYQVRKLLQQYATPYTRFRVGDRRVRPWLLSKEVKLSKEYIKQELLKIADICPLEFEK